MVAIPTSPKSHSRKQTLFTYLKPCQPAPGIATATPVADPFDTPGRLGRRRRWWLSFAFGTAHAVALGLGLWAAAAPKGTAYGSGGSTAAVTAEGSTPDGLWAYLNSDALAQDQLAGKLAAAERERLHAQQLRINAEEQAENLVAGAAQAARNQKKAAMRQVESIQLDATFIGAEQVIYGEAGDAVTLKFAARIQCQEGAFGQTAVATPVDWRITPREVRNLGTCFVSTSTPAGEPIGELGKWGVGFFKRE